MQQAFVEQVWDYYWALMDYGSHLKTTIGNISRQSKHYKKQSRFEGSRRQLRGQVLRQLAAKPTSLTQLSRRIEDERLEAVLQELLQEGLIEKQRLAYHLRNY
jgi:A/G-specific adenine glycosylase